MFCGVPNDEKVSDMAEDSMSMGGLVRGVCAAEESDGIRKMDLTTGWDRLTICRAWQHLGY
jgi:hypothetical protein